MIYNIFMNDHPNIINSGVRKGQNIVIPIFAIFQIIPFPK